MMRIVASILLLLGIFLFVSVLFNIPSWYRDEGLPLFPAFLAGEAMALGTALCAYALYAIWLKPVFGRRKLVRQRQKTNALPWAHNAQWARKRITHSAVGPAIFLWFFALNWWGAIWFVAAEKVSTIAEATVLELALFGALVLIGLITLRFAIRKTIDWLAYGRSVLVIETLPGRPGQTFTGRIETRLTRQFRKPVEISLTGFTRHWSEQTYIPHEEHRRVGDVRSAAPFHESSQKIPADQFIQTAEGTAIPVRFDIPRDAPSSGLADGDIEVVWKIDARAAGKGQPSYASSFEIPVFRS